MDPGEFNKRIVIVRDEETGHDRAGAPTFTREVVARCWAKVVFPGGREFLQGDGEVTERRVVFRIYPRRGIEVGLIVVFGGLDHDVQDIRPFDDVIELHTVGNAPGAA